MTMLIGNDSSHWDVITFPLACTGIAFEIAKSTQGISGVDMNFATSKVGFMRGGIPFGAYHYQEPAQDGAAQADNMLRIAGSNLGVYADDVEKAVIAAAVALMNKKRLRRRIPAFAVKAENFIGADEYPQELDDAIMEVLARGLTSDSAKIRLSQTLWEVTQAFLNRIESVTHKISWIYTGPYFCKTYLKPPASAVKYPLWISNPYTDDPTIPYPWNTLPIGEQYIMHQDSWKAQFPGFSPDCDRDITPLTFEQLVAVFGNGGTPPPPSPRRVMVNVTTLNIRSSTVVTPSTIIGYTSYGKIWEVTGEVQDVQGRIWYQSGPSAHLAGWLCVVV